MFNLKKKFLLAAVILIVCGGVTANYIYNKGAPDVANAIAVKVTATNLYQSFAGDSVLAKKKYLEKIVEGSGEVIQISKNQLNQPIILLKTNTSGASINCTMDNQVTNIKKGDFVIIKGICNGLGQGDADLGIFPDVYLVRCHFVR